MTRHETSEKPMRVIITGASGLVGSALSSSLRDDGHSVVPVSRFQSGNRETILWQPSEGRLDGAELEGADVVVHLAGESISAPRWTEKKKRAIRDSRIDGTRLLCTTLASLQRKPRALICASAVGIYGDRGDELLDEASSPGEGFLAEVCKDWEQACQPTRDAGIRVVNARFGMVLSRHGGALKAMLTPFRLGIGGIVGSGRQWWSWVSLNDAVAALRHAMSDESLSGPMNVTSPSPATNREFTRALGKVLSRPTILPLPAFAARLVMAEMADELLLSSARVQPRRLLDSGFSFTTPDLQPALQQAVNAG